MGEFEPCESQPCCSWLLYGSKGGPPIGLDWRGQADVVSPRPTSLSDTSATCISNRFLAQEGHGFLALPTFIGLPAIPPIWQACTELENTRHPPGRSPTVGSS